MTLTVKRKAPLQSHNSMAVPAEALALTTVADIDELNAALDLANAEQWPVLVLGEGSNTVFQNDYAGLVVLNRIGGIQILESNDQQVRLKVGAGENWHQFVEITLAKGWYGLENLALIPGLVGAAPIQNIGAYGVEVKDCVASVSVLDIATREHQSLSNQDCGFDYRDSRFKQDLAERVVITDVEFILSKTPSINLSYQGLAEQLDESATPIDVFKRVCAIRRAKLPLPGDVPNAGSFFKNPIVTAQQHDDLRQRYPGLVSFSVGGGYKIAAAWLIETAGWKQKEFDGVTVHRDQALVIVNPSLRSGASVMRFAQSIQADIKDRFGIHLEVEPQVR